jgi:hypothetical protein
MRGVKAARVSADPGTATPAARTPERRAAGPAAAALALQRTAGNRAAGRMLARWQAHPDKEQKGVMVPDSVSGEYLHFNPPKNE